jgi:hypothetical protein
MDKLEHYLDQVCRSIGGPRSLRQHVRQELREHLLDAVARQKAAGLAEAAAVERALEEFGQPEEVRSELEATHGQRLMAVVIEKAMQWKERTMRAKWLWMTWANLALALVIALEVAFLTFSVVFLVPRFQMLVRVGLIDAAILEEHRMMWMPAFLERLSVVGGGYTMWWIVLPALAWGLFEWRVTSENKPFMRLAALGTAAMGLFVVVVLTAGSLVIPYQMGMPALVRVARPFILDQTGKIDTAVTALEQALATKNWGAMAEQVDRASQATGQLKAVGYAFTGRQGQPGVEELRQRLKSASDLLQDAQQAIKEKNAGRLEAALQKFHEAYGPVRETATKSVN